MSGIDTLTDIIAPAVAAQGLCLWGVEWVRTEEPPVLRVYIDTAADQPNSVTLDHCAQASRQISATLDVADSINTPYQLEVSSPGVERRLFTPEQYAAYIDNTIAVRLKPKQAGFRRHYRGVLQAVTPEQITLYIDEENIDLSLSEIERAHLLLPTGG